MIGVSYADRHRRVLDMLAGWADHLNKCDESDDPDDKTPRDEYRAELSCVFDLYQQVGQFTGLDDATLAIVLRQVETIIRTGRCGGSTTKVGT